MTYDHSRGLAQAEYEHGKILKRACSEAHQMILNATQRPAADAAAVPPVYSGRWQGQYPNPVNINKTTEPSVCPDCKGTGEISLLTSRVPCDCQKDSIEVDYPVFFQGVQRVQVIAACHAHLNGPPGKCSSPAAHLWGFHVTDNTAEAMDGFAKRELRAIREKAEQLFGKNNYIMEIDIFYEAARQAHVITIKGDYR